MKCKQKTKIKNKSCSRQHNTNHITIETWPDIRLEDLIGTFQKFTHKTPPRGQLWNSLGCVDWHLWSERNRRLKQSPSDHQKFSPWSSLGTLGAPYSLKTRKRTVCSQLENDTNEITIFFMWASRHPMQSGHVLSSVT